MASEFGTSNAAPALDQAGGDQHPQAAAQAARGRGHGEHQEARQEDAPRAQPVPERAAGEQQRGEDQRVGIDDPLQAGHVGGEFLSQRVQRDVDDADIQQDNHEAKRGGRQRRAPKSRVKT